MWTSGRSTSEQSERFSSPAGRAPDGERELVLESAKPASAPASAPAGGGGILIARNFSTTPVALPSLTPKTSGDAEMLTDESSVKPNFAGAQEVLRKRVDRLGVVEPLQQRDSAFENAIATATPTASARRSNIVLPSATELADAGGPWNAGATVRGFYDDNYITAPDNGSGRGGIGGIENTRKGG